MRLFSLFALFTLFLIACQDDETTGVHAATLAHGQMPALTADARKNIHLAYGYGDSIMYCTSTDEGKSFTRPSLIDTLTDLIDYATRGPQISATKNGIVVIAVNKQGDIFSYAQVAAGTWKKTAKVNDADTTNKEGFLGLSSEGDSTLFAIWPDLRNDGYNKIYGARSTDCGQTWGKNMLVYASPDNTVCECCKPSVAMNGRQVYVMFRNWINGDRDMYLVQSGDAGATFGEAEKLGMGNWKLDGCPMDGGGIAINNNVIQTIWRRKDSIYTAMLGKQEQFITKGKHCIVAANESNVVNIWENGDQIYYRWNTQAAQLIAKGSSPALQMIGANKFLCVWTDNNIIQYRIITM